MRQRSELLAGENRYGCARCRRRRDATKQLFLQRPPAVLVVQLKRFLYTAESRDKITTFVEFPTGGLDMGEFMAGLVDGDGG
jgi:ubiquitin C-terminal hydrolase